MLAACPFPANHGTPGSIREMAEAVADAGHETHVVTYHYGERIPLRGIHLHRITGLTREKNVVVGPTIRRPLYDLQMVFTALRVIRRHRPHVLHAHGYEAALVAAVCRLFTSIPVVYSAHNTMADELPSYGFIRPRWLAVAVARGLDTVVPRLAHRCLPHSANAARFLERQGLRHRTDDVINFGIDVGWMTGGNGSRVRERYGLARDPVVLYSGVLDRFQRLDLLLEAMVLVTARVPSSRLLVVATLSQEAYAAALRAEASRLGIADRVVITDPQPLEAVRDILQAADVAVVPRPAAPGFPIKLMNYMAARRPAVLFATSANTGITHRYNAMLARPDTPEALAAEIVALLEDERLRREIGQRGFDFVRTHHDRAAIAGQLTRCYQRAMRPPHARKDECHAFSS
jgi:glycosyltransferase involved in cell wall biosynthesis